MKHKKKEINVEFISTDLVVKRFCLFAGASVHMFAHKAAVEQIIARANFTAEDNINWRILAGLLWRAFGYEISSYFCLEQTILLRRVDPVIGQQITELERPLLEKIKVVRDGDKLKMFKAAFTGERLASDFLSKTSSNTNAQPASQCNAVQFCIKIMAAIALLIFLFR